MSLETGVTALAQRIGSEIKNVKTVGVDTTVQPVSGYILNADKRSTTMTYTNGVLTGIVIKSGSTVVSTITLVYSGDLLQYVQEVSGGKTVKTNMSYTSGEITGTTKTVT